MRKVTHRKPTFNKTMDKAGKAILQHAEDLWKLSSGLDTAVREDMATGLAHIVAAGYDTIASNLDLPTEGWMSYIDGATADWFRKRGFAEWFCVGAGAGFRKSRPRTLSERPPIRIRRVRAKRNVKKVSNLGSEAA